MVQTMANSPSMKPSGEKRSFRQSLAPLEPNSPEWLAKLREINPGQAAMIEKLAGEHEDTNFCGVCGDDTTNTLTAPHLPFPIRLCDGCKSAQEDLYNYVLTKVSPAS